MNVVQAGSVEKREIAVEFEVRKFINCLKKETNIKVCAPTLKGTHVNLTSPFPIRSEWDITFGN